MMPWFKVDDGFHAHPKALAAGNAALGLWTRCGSYASSYVTDGFVPENVAKTYGKRSEIASLVAAGLWRKVDGGYQMHDFLDFNPSAEKVQHDRAKTAERVRRFRQTDKTSNGVTDTVTDPACNGVSNTTPSRPVPYISTSIESRQSGEHPAQDDDDFHHTVQLIVQARMNGRHIDRPRAYQMTARTNTIHEDGDLIHRLLADGTNPEHAALFVLGHGATTQNERAANPTPWCPTDCPTCDGTAWIDTGNGLAPCPERKATA